MFAGVEVAVDNAAFQFDKLYSYNLPAGEQPPQIGARVLVPFGKSGSRMGVVLGHCAGSDRFKTVIDMERGTPLLGEEMVRLIHFLKQTTFCTYYDAVKAVLPKNLRLVPNDDGTAVVSGGEGHTELVFAAAESWREAEKLTEKQKSILALLEQEPKSYGELQQALGVSRETVARLEKKGLAVRCRRQKQSAEPAWEAGGADFTLSAAQQQAFEELCSAMDDPGRPNTTLLHGVTSSGKTLLYIALIRRVVEAGKQVLLLVPEIALATQMISRLRAQFPGRVGILHSALSDSERAIQWNNAKNGEYDIVVGTRSAVFSPLARLGLIILDEEQEGGYNSDKAPRYRAVSVAAMRAAYHGAQLLLSSATPSVESYYRAEQGSANLVRLSQRYGDMPLPAVTVADMRQELLGGNSGSIGGVLYEKIKQRLERGEQCILLLNRRGYRTVTICRDCKQVIQCESCAMPMVWHKQDNSHRCHYCGKQQPAPSQCPVCGGELRHTGIGTQKIEEELQTLFPTARVLRVDLDSVSQKGALQRALQEFRVGSYDIMVGTQMIAKGLDFQNVTLAGVLNIDNMLLMPSYRAFERAFDMLTQVVGRSGRGSKEGEAVIQTVDPENPIIRMAAAQDYQSFYRNEIVLRKAHLYPPFCAMGAVCFADADAARVKQAAEAFAALLRTNFGSRPEIPLRVLGPAPMRLAMVGGVYRWRVLLKCRGDAAFRAVLAQTLQDFSAQSRFSRTRVWADFTNESES